MHALNSWADLCNPQMRRSYRVSSAMSAVKNKSAEAAARASKRTPPAEAASDPGLIAKAARAAAKRARREAREADATKTAAAAESAVIADSEKAAVPPA